MTKQEPPTFFAVDAESVSTCPTTTDSTSTSNYKKKKKQHNEKLSSSPPLVTYELFMWVTFVTVALLATIDRFIWNVWPRQTYSIGSGSAGNDRMEGFKPGPWSVVLYDVLARISGRYSIICYNFLLLTRLESLENFLHGDSFIARHVLDCSDIVNANIRSHTINGIGLCILTLLHVWSILFPCLFHGYSAKVVPGTFEWPLSERTPKRCTEEDPMDGCWPGDANVDLKQMGLQADDVFRMVEMTLLLAILMPLSIRWLSRRWHAAIRLHQFINVIYFVDIVRRHSHPHSWILNTPMFVLYVIDKSIYSNYWRRNNCPPVKKITLGSDFMILFWKSPFGPTNTVGPDYSLRLENSSFLESKHVFTCFENRSGEGFVGGGDTTSNLGDDNFEWTVGSVIRVFNNPRVPQLGSLDPISHTKRIYEAEESPNLLITGPRQGEMSEVLRHTLLSSSSSSEGKKKIVIIGGGSAINFIIDTIQWCSWNKTNCFRDIEILYTTRNIHLFVWVKRVLSLLIPSCHNAGIIFNCTLAFTGEVFGHDEEDIEDMDVFKDNPTKQDGVYENMNLLLSRIDFAQLITPKSIVFCQGSAALKSVVKHICDGEDATFYGGRGGGQ